jgi:predicted HTH transcriptional regulator
MGELVVTFRSAASSPTSELVQPTYPTVANMTSAFSKSEVGIEIGSLNSLPETLTQDIRGTGAINPAIYADVDERLKAAMQHVHTQGSITNRDYRAITGVSESTGMRDLEILVKRGSLRAVGQKKARRYILP